MAVCQPCEVVPPVEKKPVCVLGLGLIGGSLLRSATAARREAFGYNRSPDAAEHAVADGFDADSDLDAVLRRAAAVDALIVLAVPMPALPGLLARIADTAPQCVLTDVTSVKCAVHDAVDDAGLLAHFVGGHPMTGTAQSGWSAGDGGLFDGTPWVVSVDDHVDPAAWIQVAMLALDSGAMVVPARSAEHDAAVAAISHLPHLLAEVLAATAAPVPLAFALAAGSFRDGTRVAGTAPELVRAMCEANSGELISITDEAIARLVSARETLARTGSIAGLVEAGHAAHTTYANTARWDIVDVTVGAPGWRQDLAAAGRAGGVLRSAPPVLGSRQ